MAEVLTVDELRESLRGVPPAATVYACVGPEEDYIPILAAEWVAGEEASAFPGMFLVQTAPIALLADSRVEVRVPIVAGVAVLSMPASIPKHRRAWVGEQLAAYLFQGVTSDRDRQIAKSWMAGGRFDMLCTRYRDCFGLTPREVLRDLSTAQLVRVELPDQTREGPL